MDRILIMLHTITLSILLATAAYITYRHNKKQVKELESTKIKEKKTTPNSYAIFLTIDNHNCRKSCMPDKTQCGTTCSYKKLQELVNIIEDAQYSLDLCMYILTLNELALAIVRAHERGVTVRLIVDQDMNTSINSKVAFCKSAGIPVAMKKITMVMHHKFCIIDAASEERGKLITGSLNWTLQGITGNYENVAVIMDRKTVTEFATEYEKLWEYFTST